MRVVRRLEIFPLTRALKVGLALLMAGSMWYYLAAVLIPYQRTEAAIHHTPRGNLSDLYPRWLGARELLLHGRDPYSAEITREIQIGYYGEVLDTARPNPPKDQQRFAYPVYVVFLLAPMIKVPFPTLRMFFRLLLLVLTVASVPLWIRALKLHIERTTVAIIVVLLLGSFPVGQGLYLDQLTLLVCFLIAAACAALASGMLMSAGILLAVATIKPQIALPVIAWLVLWGISEWQRRRRFLWGFAATMMALLGGAEWLLPGWFRRWQSAVSAYFDYAGARSLLEVLMGRNGGLLACAALTLMVAVLCWLVRREPASSYAFNVGLLAVLAVDVLVKPKFPLYDGIILLPVILWLWTHRGALRQGSWHARSLYWMSSFLIAGQWVGAFALTALSLLGMSSAAQYVPHLPVFALFAFPIAVFFLLALCATDITRNRALLSQAGAEPGRAVVPVTAGEAGR